MKKMFFYGMLALAPFLLAFSQIANEKTLADELVGTYMGMYANDGSLNKEFKVKVTKLSDSTIQITPIGAPNGTSFQASVREDNMSAIRVVRLEAIGGEIVLKNGMMTPANGRLSYGISKDSGHFAEVFSGVKQ